MMKNKQNVRLDPVFVIGYSRSGTTMLRLMLNRHPDLFIPKESEYFQKVPRQYRDRIHQVKDIDRILKTLPNYYDSILNEEQFRELLKQNLPGDNRILLACLYQACAASMGKNDVRWGEKKPQNWQFVYRLQSWYPQAQFVNIIRDPRDVITSMERSLSEIVPLRTIFPAHIILAWQWQFVFKTMIQQEKILGNQRYLKLRYEDLVSEPITHLTTICEFLSLSINFVNDMLNFNEDARDPKIGDGGQHMLGTKKKLNVQSIGNFNKFLSEQQIREIEFICGDIMEEMGYVRLYNSPTFADRTRIITICNILTSMWRCVRGTRLIMGSL
ncbi:MAG: sulfotransferase [Calothrix sp. MO_167.B12]|nr:sulfotransferase [Calothrix sp. MO_167.B12]